MCLSIWELLHLIEERGTATCFRGPMTLWKGLQSFKTRGEKSGDWLSLKAKWSKRNLKGEGIGWQTSRKSTKNTASIIHCFISWPCGPILVLHLIYIYLCKWRGEVVTPLCHGSKIPGWQQSIKVTQKVNIRTVSNYIYLNYLGVANRVIETVCFDAKVQ